MKRVQSPNPDRATLAASDARAAPPACIFSGFIVEVGIKSTHPQLPKIVRTLIRSFTTTFTRQAVDDARWMNTPRAYWTAPTFAAAACAAPGRAPARSRSNLFVSDD